MIGKGKKGDKKEEAKKNESKSKVVLAKHSVLKKVLVATLVILALTLTLGIGIASATTHVVNQTDPACTAGDAYYATIQAAVNAAGAGDIIIVCHEATAYQETVVVNKSDIVIKAHDGTKPVVSANGADDHVFNITDQRNVTLQGFEIRDARSTTQHVAGIYMTNTSDCNISDNFVTNISAIDSIWAFGIRLYSSNNNTFSSSTTVSYINASYANGIWLKSSNNNSFSSSTTVSYINATTGPAIGIYLWYSNNNSFGPSTTVSYVDATGPATGSADGIWLESSNNNSFNSSTTVSYINTTNRACGIRLWKSSEDNEFYDCTISDLTGGVGTSYGVCMLESSDNNTVSRAKIFRGAGPRIDYGVYMENCTWNSILDSEIRNNSHGVWVNQSDSNTIERNMIVNNTVTGTGVHLTAGSAYNEIHENCFYDNVPQAWDNGTGNNWTGNFWSDYAPPPPYLINGTADSEDGDPLQDCPLIGQPDLNITDKSEDRVNATHYNIIYTVCNIGNASAGGSNTTITIDSVDVLEDPAPPLGVGECYTNTVGPFECTAPSDTIKVCADNDDDVDESNEMNNCMENVLECVAPARVPALTPIGLIALVGLLSVVLAVSIRIRIRRKK